MIYKYVSKPCKTDFNSVTYMWAKNIKGYLVPEKYTDVMVYANGLLLMEGHADGDYMIRKMYEKRYVVMHHQMMTGDMLRIVGTKSFSVWGGGGGSGQILTNGSSCGGNVSWDTATMIGVANISMDMVDGLKELKEKVDQLTAELKEEKELREAACSALMGLTTSQTSEIQIAKAEAIGKVLEATVKIKELGDEFSTLKVHAQGTAVALNNLKQCFNELGWKIIVPII